MPGDRLHNRLVLVGVAMPVVDVGDAAVLVTWFVARRGSGKGMDPPPPMTKALPLPSVIRGPKIYPTKNPDLAFRMSHAATGAAVYGTAEST